MKNYFYRNHFKDNVPIKKVNRTFEIFGKTIIISKEADCFPNTFAATEASTGMSIGCPDQPTAIGAERTAKKRIKKFGKRAFFAAIIQNL